MPKKKRMSSQSTDAAKKVKPTHKWFVCCVEECRRNPEFVDAKSSNMCPKHACMLHHNEALEGGGQKLTAAVVKKLCSATIQYLMPDLVHAWGKCRNPNGAGPGSVELLHIDKEHEYYSWKLGYMDYYFQATIHKPEYLAKIGMYNRNLDPRYMCDFAHRQPPGEGSDAIPTHANDLLALMTSAWRYGTETDVDYTYRRAKNMIRAVDLFECETGIFQWRQPDFTEYRGDLLFGRCAYGHLYERYIMDNKASFKAFGDIAKKVQTGFHIRIRVEITTGTPLVPVERAFVSESANIGPEFFIYCMLTMPSRTARGARWPPRTLPSTSRWL